MTIKMFPCTNVLDRVKLELLTCSREQTSNQVTVFVCFVVT